MTAGPREGFCPGAPAKAIRTAGSKAERRASGGDGYIALLIGLKAQFYELVSVSETIL